MKTNQIVEKKQKCLPLREFTNPAVCGHIAAVLFCALLFYSISADAVGFRLPNQDPEGIARGNAFAATADNPSAIYYNPAGITQLEGQNFSAGLYLISASTKYEAPSGATAQTKADFQPVPQFYYTFTPKDFALPLSFGLGVYVPYGLSVDWGNNGPFRNVAQDGSLLYATVNPIVAWKITPELSIGIGPTINYSKVDFNRGLGVIPNDQFHFVGDDYNFGFTAGARWQPCDLIAFGVNYRYVTAMDYRGHSTTSPSPPLFPPATHTSASIDFPQNVVGGVSFRPTPNWNLEFDLDWTDWSVVKQAVFQNTAVGTQALPLHFKSGFMYEFGVTRKLPKGYFVSAGYIYSENSSPNQFYDPLIPDADLHLGNVGFGHKGARWNWAFSYTLAINPSRHVSGDSYDGSPAAGTMVNGTYRTFNNALNASIGLKF